jgi:Zn-dependent protease with chaperone function
VTTAADDGPRHASTVRLVALVLEGYAYLACIVALFLSAPAFLVWGLVTRRPSVAIAAILVGVPIAATAGRALRALWIARDEPQGIEIGPRVGGRLHGEVREIARRIGAPAVHRIIVTPANNASVLQVPRLGIVWPRNVLCLGYPLMATISIEHLRAVIAHELGHLAHGHGRVASWAYRTQLTWSRLLETLRAHGSLPPLVFFLARHYVPRLRAQAAVVSRQQELLADRLAAHLCGPAIAAQALTTIELAEQAFERQFWPRIYGRVADEPDAPAPFSEMGPQIWSDVDDPPALLERLSIDGARSAESHPALSERLRALRQRPEWPGAVPVPAIEEMFGSQRAALAATLDERWRTSHGREWTRRHEEIQRRRAALGELSRVASPTPEQVFQRGELTELDEDADGALRLYLLAHESGHRGAALAAGRILLDRDDESGLAYINGAIDADPDLVEDGCRAIIGFLERRGRHAEAFQYERRLARLASVTSMADGERRALSAVDRFRPCADPRLDRGALARRLAGEPDVLRAFLAAKELRYSTGTLTVLAVLTKDGAIGELRERLARDGLLPEDVTVAALGRHDRALEAALGSDALVYDRERSSASPT